MVERKKPMADVTRIYGETAPEEREASQNTVEILELLLQRAKAGECIGVVVAVALSDGSADWTLAGRLGKYSLLGALVAANARVLELEHADG